MTSTQPAERRRSTSSVKAVVRRPEAVRWGPAATAQLSRRQRRKSTGTSGRPDGAGQRRPAPAPAPAPAAPAASRRRGPAGGGGRRPGRRGAQAIFARSRRPGARPASTSPPAATAAIAGEQQQGDQRRQRRLLDRRRAPLPSPSRPIAPTLGGRGRTRGAQKVPIPRRRCRRFCLHEGDGGPSTFSATPRSSAPAWRSSRSRCSPRSGSPGPTTRSSSRSR